MRHYPGIVSTALLPLAKLLFGMGLAIAADSSSDLEIGLSAFEKGNYDLAYQKLLPLSSAGVAMAQNTLGRMYMTGRGVTQDDAQALLLFRKAASQGLPNAKNNVGAMYAAGRGLKQDYQQAVAWFLEAANQGFPLAMENLAEMYVKGLGVKPDRAEAERWRSRARITGFIGEKGQMNIEAVGQKEYEQGLKLSYQGKFADAAPFFQQAAEKGHPEAQLVLSMLYQNGEGVQKDKEQAEYWTREAAKQGPYMARITGNKEVLNIKTVGQKEYEQGLKLYYLWKFAEAAPFFQQAAEKGHPEAQLILGMLYQGGQGVPKDKGQAEYWTQEAAKQGHHMKDNRDRVVINSSKEKIEENEKTISSPRLPVCGCSRDISPQECARRFSCRVP